MFSIRQLHILLIFAAIIIFANVSCTKESFHRTEGLVWNTSYHIIYEGDPSLEDSLMAVLNDVNNSLNVFNTSSLVSRINIDSSAVVDSHFKKVYTSSLIVNKASGGLFDPTLSPLITAWGFGKGHHPTADTLNVSDIMKYIGINKTRLNGDTLIKDDPRINFNFSAVAKGYGCDAIAEMLKRNNVENYLIEIGGEIAAGGFSPKGELWRISIDKPVESDSAIIHDACAVVNVSNAGVATSGNYRNFRKVGERSIGHMISPVTGYPVATDVVSATVIAPTAMEADATATACMVAGSEDAKLIIGRLGYECLLVLSDSTTWLSPGMTKYLSK